MAGLTFLILFLVLMTLMALVPRVLKPLHVPGVISIILIGIVIGPNCLDVVRLLNDHLGRGYPTAQLYTTIDALGLLGLIFLMTLAGMECDLSLIRAERRGVFWLSTMTFLVPAAAGYLVFAYFCPSDVIGMLFYASLFASHSVGIVFPIIRELNIVRTRFGVAVLASTVITDVASLILLAVCVQLKRHGAVGNVKDSISLFDNVDPGLLGAWFIPLFILAVLGYIALSLWLTPVLGRWLLKYLHPRDDSRLTFFLVAVLLVVFIGEVIGVSIIVGAFIAGMALVQVKAVHEESGILHRKLEGIGYGFIIPFLFLSIGMKTNLAVLFTARENASIVVLTVVGLVSSKMLSGWVAMRLSGFTHAKSICAGLMTVPQLSATLAAATVGRELGIIADSFFNAIIVLSIVTTLPVPVLVRLLIAKVHITFDSAEDKLKGTAEPMNVEEEYI